MNHLSMTIKGPNIDVDFSLISLDGKTPTDKGWQKYCEKKSPYRLKNFKGKNYGIATGPASKCLVLDIDDSAAFANACKKNGWDSPTTFTIETGSGGLHFYFLYPQDGRKYGNLSRKKLGFDVRGHGGQVVGPGSIHPDTGKPYFVKNDVPMASAPAWLLGLYSKPEPKPKPSRKSNRRYSADDIDRLPIKPETKSLIRNGAAKGRRSEAIFTVLGALIFSGLSDSEIFSIFDQYPIGEKYREIGNSRERWLQPQIDKARGCFTERADDSRLSNEPNKPTQENTISDEQLLKDYRKLNEPDPEQIRAAKAAVVRILNKKFAAILIDGKFTIIMEHVQPTTGRADISYLRKQDFLSRFENRTIITGFSKGNPAFSTWAQIWTKSPDRREYNGLIFDTSKTSNNGYFNLYKPPALKAGPGNCKLYLEHVENIICSGDGEIFRWVLDWMAWLVQNKGQERPGTAIVLRGSQGTGKGTFVEPFGHVFGSHFLHITQQVHFAGRFTEHFKNVILAFVDEALWAGDRKAEGHIKGLITEPTVLIEPKFVNPYPVKNHVNFIFASNSDWIVPTGLEERRFLALHVSSDRKRDYQYFSTIKKQMATGGVADLAHYLSERKVTCNLREAPRTEEFLGQVIESMEPEQQWWFQLLQDGQFIHPDEQGQPSSPTWHDLVSRNGLYAMYARFCERMNIHNRLLSPTQFGRRMRSLANITNGPRKAFSMGGDRARTYRLPMLQCCREQFDAKLTYRINWDNDDEVPF